MKMELEGLLRTLEAIYPHTQIARFCAENGEEWYYSLCQTNLQRHGTLIVGFNWGAGKNVKYSAQEQITKTDFYSEDVGSLSRTFSYLDKYLGIVARNNVSQTNYCFFRSHTESQISPQDIEVCKPIFEELISILKPTNIICLSATLRDYWLSGNELLDQKRKDIVYPFGEGCRTSYVVKGMLYGNTATYCLPHPNSKIPGRVRDEAWEFCFSDQ
ncbi:MAG: hypothetical protein P1U47_00760 [Zhongshania sp.]|uniref:hypothetical protein n=1 Tax=Zhongshania sp. TaxID=1971902 RepID=UPI0026153B62|nr:hypothetical protein [Zhongshania sp.]MDF1690874.1 hypothetical protein [Zhongshania sp.]